MWLAASHLGWLCSWDVATEHFACVGYDAYEIALGRGEITKALDLKPVATRGTSGGTNLSVSRMMQCEKVPTIILKIQKLSFCKELVVSIAIVPTYGYFSI